MQIWLGMQHHPYHLREYPLLFCAGQSAWWCLSNPLATHIAMSHNRHAQYTHHLLHTRGIVKVRNIRRQAADKSYVFCVLLGVSGGGGGQNLYACVGICECVFSGMFSPSSECVHECISKTMHIDVCQQWSLCFKQKILLVHVEKGGLKEMRTWILSFSGLTLARPLLANSRQQIRSWELQTVLVTGMWWRAGGLGYFTACMDHDRIGMLSLCSQNT